MEPSTPLIDIDPAKTSQSQFNAGEWTPFSVTVKRSQQAARGVRIKNLASADKDVEVDTALLDRGLSLLPGESWRLTVPIQVRVPKEVSLKALEFQVQEDGEDEKYDKHVAWPDRLFNFLPALGKEIEVSFRPICAYDEDVKGEIVLQHRGPTVFRDFTVNVTSPEALKAGKTTVARPEFRLGQEVSWDVVVCQSSFTLSMVGNVGEGQTSAQASAQVNVMFPAIGADNRQKFRFLEPRRLSNDDIEVSEVGSDRPVSRRQGIFPLERGQQYEILIRPKHGPVTNMTLHGIPGRVHVHKQERQDDEGTWSCLIEVESTADLLSKPQALYYEVESKGEKLANEIPICLNPTSIAHWRVAAYLGIALTIQSVTALIRLLKHP
jgi:hypothetical protein